MADSMTLEQETRVERLRCEIGADVERIANETMLDKLDRTAPVINCLIESIARGIVREVDRER